MNTKTAVHVSIIEAGGGERKQLRVQEVAATSGGIFMGFVHIMY